MHPPYKIFKFTGLLFILIPLICFAQDRSCLPQKFTPHSRPLSGSFLGEINANNIYVRSDSTVSSKIICTVNDGQPVAVVKELYEWYKIRLPKIAPSFIKKDLVILIDNKTAKAIKDSVNIRLNPDDSSPILGKLGKNEVIVIVENMGEWYKIEPINESFGWVNKKFVNLAPLRATANKKEEVKLVQKVEKENKITDEKTYLQENVTIEGIIKPYGKVFKRIATHKLITLDNNVFLLKGNKASLDSLNYQKERITGKSTHPKNQKYTVMEIEKIEAMD